MGGLKCSTTSGVQTSYLADKLEGSLGLDNFRLL